MNHGHLQEKAGAHLENARHLFGRSASTTIPGFTQNVPTPPQSLGYNPQPTEVGAMQAQRSDLVYLNDTNCASSLSELRIYKIATH